jgi:hypothetical protein
LIDLGSFAFALLVTLFVCFVVQLGVACCWVLGLLRVVGGGLLVAGFAGFCHVQNTRLGAQDYPKVIT